VLIHLGGAFGTILIPIVLFATKKDESPFIRHHALEAINFHLTLYVACVAGFVSMFFLIGFLLLPVIILAFYVLTVVATVAASRGEWYRYPACIRFIT
jgi:uncharacterized Tic20 family protein